MVFPREILAWAIMAIDEEDVVRLHSNGVPEAAIQDLKKIRLPDTPAVVDIKNEPTLIITGVFLASSKNKTLKWYFERNGWTNALALDPYSKAGIYVQNNPLQTFLNFLSNVIEMMEPPAKGKMSAVSSDLQGRRIHLFLTLLDIKIAVGDDDLRQIIDKIEKIRNLSNLVRCVHINEEAQSQIGAGIGPRLYAMLADVGIVCFRASGITRTLQVLWHSKMALEDTITPKGFAVFDLWITRAATVSFLLLEPHVVANVTEDYLNWARNAGQSAWDAEIAIDRALTVEAEIQRAKTTSSEDPKFLLRRVLSARIPIPTPFTQAFWISGHEVSERKILC